VLGTGDGWEDPVTWWMCWEGNELELAVTLEEHVFFLLKENISFFLSSIHVFPSTAPVVLITW
jgi:hypothetical protein